MPTMFGGLGFKTIPSLIFATLVLPTTLSLVSSTAQAADPAKPHTHTGVGERFTSPAKTQLTRPEIVQLIQGSLIRKQVRYEDGGRGIAILDVAAPPEDIWKVIVDYPHYPDWIDQAQECEVYKNDGENIYARFLLKVFTFNVEYYIHHVYQPQNGQLTWSLDYSRLSDLDDSTGYWLVYPAPEHEGHTRVEYSVDLRLSGWVPGVVEDMLANKGLEQATSWVKQQAEE